MSLKMISLIKFILIIGTLFQEIRTLPVEEVDELVKNDTLSFAAEETLTTPFNGSLSLLANEPPESPTEEQLSSSTSEAPSPANNEAASPSADKILPTLDDEKLLTSTQEPLLAPSNETLSAADNEGLSPSANETLSLSSSINETLSPPLNETLSSASGTLSPAANRTVKLPTIVYGPINQQLGNKYLSLEKFRPQMMNQLLLELESSTDLQPHKTITASPFLTDNEINPVLRKNAKDDSTRQAKEIEWLTTVASHRMKFIKLYKLLSSTYNKLKLKSKVTTEELDAAKRRKNILSHSEEKLKKTTQDLVVYVLSK
nr:BV-like protein [Cotesia vestalis bracovirus]